MELTYIPRFSTPDELWARLEHLPLPEGQTVIIMVWEDGTLSIEKRHGFPPPGQVRGLGGLDYWHGRGKSIEEAIENAELYRHEVPAPKAHDWLWEIVEGQENP